MDILEFVLEMKFSDLNALHQKFFQNLKAGLVSKSDWWARERVGLLKRHGLLKTQRVSFSGVSYFLATELARTVLSNVRSERSFVRALDGVDIRTFEHDRRVIEARLMLERLGRATGWCSERRLKSESSLILGLPRAYQPDAIYQNKLTERVAFELELSAKTKERYEDKVRKYVDVMRTSEAIHSGFSGVLFVTCNDHIFSVLSELTRRYVKFKVEKFNELLKESSREVGINGA